VSVETPPALSLDRQAVAVAVNTQVRGSAETLTAILDLGSAVPREIPQQPGTAVGFRRGAGFFLHHVYDGTSDVSWLVTPQTAAASRSIGTGYVFWTLASPFGSRVAYSECADGGRFSQYDTCAPRLVVESADGAARRELSKGSKAEAFAFTPDDRFLLVREQVGAIIHLMRYELASGARLDLGTSDLDTFETFDGSRGGSLISPDGREAIVRRGRTLVAVSLDGTGARTVASLAEFEIARAVFTGSGDVVYELTMQRPGNDIVDSSPSVWRSRGGELAQVAPRASCGLTVFSRSGKTAARVCVDGIHVLSLDEAKEVRTIRGATWPAPALGALAFVALLGIDADDRGLIAAVDPTAFDAAVAADYQLVYLGTDGTQTELGRARNTPGRGGAFDYLP
jgi:hypothetical protein